MSCSVLDHRLVGLLVLQACGLDSLPATMNEASYCVLTVDMPKPV